MSALNRVRVFKTQPTRSASKLSPHTISALTGVPEELLKERVVKIFKPSRCTMQAGTGRTKFWTLEFEREGDFKTPLMGWTGTTDPVQNISLEFNTPEEAIEHAKRSGTLFRVLFLNHKGLKYTVDYDSGIEETQNEKSYADNFKYKPFQKNPFE